MCCATCRYARPTDNEQRLHCMGPRSWQRYPASMPDWRTLPAEKAAHWESAVYYVKPEAGESCQVYEEGVYVAPAERRI